jgi:autotransporter strand-loop-strand O-heptosyltransferase
MKNRGIEVYKSIVRNPQQTVSERVGFTFSFDYGPRVDMTGNDHRSKKTLKFVEKNTGKIIYSTETSPGLFTTLFRKWFTPWIAEAYSGEEKIWDFDFESSIYGKKILVSIDSSSLGDTLAWLPVINKMRDKFDADMYVSTFWNQLVVHFFPNLRFVHPGFRDPNMAATFGVGWYEEEDKNLHKRDPRSISLQQVAGDILGIDVDGDVLPPQLPVTVLSSQRPISEKYVCMGIESTANAKHWHYPGGWQNVVDFLKLKGYQVVVIQSQPVQLEGIIDKTGEIDIMERAIYLHHSDFFIGIGSGLSWLAWALRKPVLMISGFSLPTCEFSNKNYRVINTNVCHGCFNDTRHKFDRGDWNWCPRLKNTERMFECSTKITPAQVIGKITELIQKEGL